MGDPMGFRVAASVVLKKKDGRILLVREADPRVYGKFNLPGGHVGCGENIEKCALRELQEECGISAVLTGLIGIYTNKGGVNFVFTGETTVTKTFAGEDILECCWLLPEEISRLPDEKILRPQRMQAILADLKAERCFPCDIVRRLHPEKWENG